MSRRVWTFSAALALACVFATGALSSASAQGRGGGRGGGGGGGGMGRGGGPPAGVGVDRGLGRSSSSSSGRADTGRGNASDRSGGRSDAGLERARIRRDNARRADEDLREHPGMPARLHTTANDLREGYRAALATNPDLKFGQYVAATRLAANLGARHPNVTREAILAGLEDGRSIGRTLRDLGLGSDEAKEAERRAEREIKESRRRS
ncbi:MAG TPA: hypothetical protein VKB12_03485 [Pyrinomonadaceae bacterium]|nr:hypothetical protein [Pyrinomonadaceae bacterium]